MFYMPMLIPESLCRSEPLYVEGFAPECAVVVTKGGLDRNLKRRAFVVARPTSETLFCEHYAKIEFV